MPPHLPHTATRHFQRTGASPHAPPPPLYAQVRLNEHTYWDDQRYDLAVDLDTQGAISLQVWWEPDVRQNDHHHGDGGGGGGSPDRRLSRARPRALDMRASVADGAAAGRARACRALGALCGRVLPARMRTVGACRYVCGPVLHPDGRLRSAWNIALAFFILYCGFAVPLEIGFETDMVEDMCRDPSDPWRQVRACPTTPGTPLLLRSCPSTPTTPLQLLSSLPVAHEARLACGSRADAWIRSCHVASASPSCWGSGSI